MKFGTALVMTVLAIGLASAACGGDSEEAPLAGPGAAMGPGISVAEARDSGLSSPLLVNGFIIATEDEVRLCDSLAESAPPQCAGESLVVVGLDVSTLAGVRSAGGVRWTDARTQVLGTVDGDVMTVDSTSLGSAS